VSNMVSDKMAIVALIADCATQLIVADRHRASKGGGREPLTPYEANQYVFEAAIIFSEAFEYVEESDKMHNQP
jgi:hypothetical protein